MTRGRPREFDKEAALKEATLMFWRNGYRGVSLDDLTTAMNINKPSLYAAFGDKEALYLAAIDYYRSTIMAPPFRELLECERLSEGLAEFFRHLAKSMTTPDRPGCLISCTLTQDVCESEAIKEKLADVMASGDAAFTRLFKEHASELRSHLTPEEAAQLMFTVLHGMTIRARSGATAKDLAPIAQSAIKAICKD
jgi:TetR/AcrR family transcriptional regulator, copper-responsive repressor